MSGAELRKLRDRLGWSQARMARELGLKHRNSIYKLESGEAIITRAIELAVNCLANHRSRRPR